MLYGCTFLTCNKTFGTKNDWKRHENSEHFHQEAWRCDKETPEGGVCAKVCYRRQSFQDHLKTKHRMEDDTIKEKAESCRMGRNCQTRFWCGFCKKLIGLKKKGVEAWTERFDHIDDHFMGLHGYKKQCILDWIPVDSTKRKGEAEISLFLGASTGNEDHSDPASSDGTSSKSTMKGDEKWLKNSSEDFIVAIRQSALDTGKSSQISKGTDAKTIEIVTNRPTPEDPLLRASEYKPENETQKSWLPNRVKSGDLEMAQQENRHIRNFRAGSLLRGGTLVWCCVALAMMALVLLWK
jgi:hypothetical protein